MLDRLVRERKENMKPEKSVIGIVMLNTSFPRPVGDIGNPDTWPFETRYKTVKAALVSEIVQSELPAAVVIQDIQDAIDELVEEGVDVITTSCGFLGALQSEIQNTLPVPFISSALLWLPELRQLYGDEATFGVLTFDSRKLRPLHFGIAGEGGCVIEGVESGLELHRVVTGGLPGLDERQACQDVLDAAVRLKSRAPGISALILECTNMSPYREVIEHESGLPVFDINSLIFKQLES